ncbi:hypothetical protein B0H19DRAFT_1385178 [Mycena capillaripes]|nr:hypothetical protein B0H19DRAFT_1385178 [Mycena capillaripes]
MLDTTRAVSTSKIPSNSTTAVCLTHRATSPPRVSFRAPDFHELARSNTSADLAIPSRIQAHVPCILKDRERRAVSFLSVLVALSLGRASLAFLTKDLVLGHQSRTCSAQMRIRISSRRPSLFPASRERRVRHAPRPPALPTARSGLLQQHDIERDALSDHEATSRLLGVPRAYDLTPDVVPRPHPQHPAPAQPDTTCSRRCCSSTRPLLSLIRGRSKDLRRSHPLSVLSARFLAPTAVHSAPCVYSPIAYTAFLGSRRSPNYPLHYSRARRSRSLLIIAGPVLPAACALRRLMRRPSASPGNRRRRITPTRLTPCLRALGARRAELDAIRAESTKKPL